MSPPVRVPRALGVVFCPFGPQGLDVRLAGLCDAAEESDFQRALVRAGLGSNLTRADMERIGFYVCVADLEDELIGALGAASVERIIDAQGELGSFRTFQKQPAQQGKSNEAQLWRFMGNRKIRYAPLLVRALDLTQVPRPLDRCRRPQNRATQTAERCGQNPGVQICAPSVVAAQYF